MGRGKTDDGRPDHQISVATVISDMMRRAESLVV